MEVGKTGGLVRLPGTPMCSHGAAEASCMQISNGYSPRTACKVSGRSHPKLTGNIGQASMEKSSGGKNKPTSLSFVGPHCGQVWQQSITSSAFQKEMECSWESQLHF